MSIFDKDLVEREPELQKFYKQVEKWIKKEFKPCFEFYHGDLEKVTSDFNRSFMNPTSEMLFKEHGIYRPYFCATWVVDINRGSKILISITHSEKDSGFSDIKTFLKIVIPEKKIREYVYI